MWDIFGYKTIVFSDFSHVFLKFWELFSEKLTEKRLASKAGGARHTPLALELIS